MMAMLKMGCPAAGLAAAAAGVGMGVEMVWGVLKGLGILWFCRGVETLLEGEFARHFQFTAGGERGFRWRRLRAKKWQNLDSVEVLGSVSRKILISRGLDAKY